MTKQILLITLTVVGVFVAFLLGAAFVTFIQFGGIVGHSVFVSDDVPQMDWEPTVYRDYAGYEEVIAASLLDDLDYRDFDDPKDLQKEILRMTDVAEAVVEELMTGQGPAPFTGVMLPSRVPAEAVAEEDQ
ncbi:MAG: hypothetical protein OXH15_13060 [Gammaproteobacteria bacterium]|nr:hypothetical protein [Gammaproteobacteria bacterium]